MELAAKNEDLLNDTLSDEPKEPFDRYKDCVAEITTISDREMFAHGFRLSVKPMIDIMKGE